MSFFCIHCRSRIEPTYKACPHCGEPISDFLRRHLDEPVDGKYQILSRLAVGGMGEVYKALHIHLNSLRVIKLLRPHSAGDRVARERFMREARLATKINHPNAATLYDFAALDDGSWYMVTEYIEGTNLQELIAARGPLAPRYAAGIALQVLAGLEAIHRAGIVHRDISPENLMITRTPDGDEHVKIIDLGIAKSTLPEDTATQAGAFVGKWKYCSPEHLGVLPPGGRIDARADLYSFGVVLYEMLAGVPPFRADSPHEYVVLHSSAEPPPLRDANPELEPIPELERIVMKALEKERERRWASAAEMAAEIAAIEELLPAYGAGQPGAAAAAEPTFAATVDASPVRRSGEPLPETTHAAGPPPRTPRDASARIVRPAIRNAAIAAVAIALAWAAFHFTRTPDVVSRPPSRSAVAGVPQPVEPGHVGINAYPWAQVMRIREVASNRIITPPPGEFTPVSVKLAPGAWEITLSNPSFAEPLMVSVVVVAGSEQVVNAQFNDPRYAPLPDFGGGD